PDAHRERSGRGADRLGGANSVASSRPSVGTWPQGRLRASTGSKPVINSEFDSRALGRTQSGSNTTMSRRFLVAAAAAAFACAASVHAADKVGSTVDAHGVTVQVGAEYSGIAYPEPVQIDIHNDPVGREWFPGDPIREIPRQHWADPAVLA